MRLRDRILSVIIQNKKMLLYIVFGVLTTLVNFITYFVLFKNIGFSNVLSNLIAWFISVVFAFIVNKVFVFSSSSFRTEVVISEFIKFTSVRITTGLLETAIMFIGVDLLSLKSLYVKAFASLFVLISNYIGSEYIIFRRNK